LTQNHFFTPSVFSSVRLSVPDNFEASVKGASKSGVALRLPPQSKKVRQEDVPNASARSSF